jgi:LPPG:FO 2-phospho-L-lactate transferase
MMVALAGGVGGAKLAFGLNRVLPPDRLTLVVNTGDDFEHLGLHIAPDLDTVMYTLAGLANPETGWGVVGETWGFMQAAERLGAPNWFRLGDRDMATHVLRAERLRAGRSLTEVTAEFCTRLGIGCTVLPASDDPVRTTVRTDAGTLAFQDYFVRLHCEPAVKSFHFRGAETARANPKALAALADPRLEAVVFCPSNPFVSVAPILAIPALDRAFQDAKAPKIAVSPIIGGQAVKGPAAKMMRELGLDVSALGVARHYRGLIDGLVLDQADAALAPEVEALGMRAAVLPTMMRDDRDRIRLARDVVGLARSWPRAS